MVGGEQAEKTPFVNIDLARLGWLKRGTCFMRQNQGHFPGPNSESPSGSLYLEQRVAGTDSRTAFSSRAAISHL